MKIYWRRGEYDRRTIHSFVSNLDEIHNQQRRAEVLIFGLSKMLGERAHAGAMCDSIAICAHHPFCCNFEVTLREGDEEVPVVMVEFYHCPEERYRIYVSSPQSGLIEDATVPKRDLAREIAMAVARALRDKIPEVARAYTAVYKSFQEPLDSELDPEVWTIRKREDPILKELIRGAG